MNFVAFYSGIVTSLVKVCMFTFKRTDIHLTAPLLKTWERSREITRIFGIQKVALHFIFRITKIHYSVAFLPC